MIWAGLVAGIIIFAINLVLIVLILRKAQGLPEEEAPRYIAVRYYIRYAILLVLLGLAVWVWGANFALGTMAGILVAKLIFLVIGGKKGELFVRLLRSDE